LWPFPPKDDLTREQQEIVEAAAERLYGLIHARFVITTRGIQNMVEKYKGVEFGRCPRVFCQGQPVLPVGQSDVPQTHTVKLFCPRCLDIYYPKNARHQQLDGAYWGTTFPHMLFQMHPELVPTLPDHKYVPRIYGFRINERAANWPRPSRAALERGSERGKR
jgi:casein kinase II subunit beta